MRYRGRYEHTIDAKGRLAIPARWRTEMETTGAIVARGLDPCLVIYDRPEWEAYEQRILNISEYTPEGRRLRRLILGEANDQQLDSQGRVLLPNNLRSVAGLLDDGNATLIGVGDHIEVWNRARYDAEQTAIDDQREQILSQAAQSSG